MPNIPFDNSYAKLGEPFYIATQPVPVAKPELIIFNHQLATDIGLSVTDPASPEWLGLFSGNDLSDGAYPIAMAYAGHQFGHFNEQLGDGRALQLGEIVSPDGIRYDIQLKGSGPTAFSRGGDGRAALGPVLREYLLCETMARFGIPTTRALAAVTSGEEVARTQLLPGAILTRLATSYVRVGTFQYFAARGNHTAVQKLADYVITRNYPAAADADNPYVAMLGAIIKRQAQLIAKWMQIGFIHGVMNTDNMSVAGETIDYGPCAFMDSYSHEQVYSSIDHNGRYAYSNQPPIAQWNLVRLAESLLPLLADDENTAVKIARDLLNAFPDQYESFWLAGMLQKVGLSSAPDKEKGKEKDKTLIENLLTIMEQNQADFTLTFYYLSQLNRTTSETNMQQEEKLRSLFSHPNALDNWLEQWRARLAIENMSDKQRKALMFTVNPTYIPRNHLIEEAIRAAEDHHDFSVFYALHEVLQSPYHYQAGKERYMQPPRPDEIVHQTFCGT